MAEEDIYGTKEKWESFLSSLDVLTLPPKERPRY